MNMQEVASSQSSRLVDLIANQPPVCLDKKTTSKLQQYMACDKSTLSSLL